MKEVVCYETQDGKLFTSHEKAYGQLCSIQKSSLAGEDCIWLGVDNTGPRIEGATGAFNSSSNRMHLTQGMAQTLLPMLIRFVNTGEIG